jgi:TatD DNase family protein
MDLVDSHAHLDFPDFEDDLGLVIKNADEVGVKKIINVGADLERSRAGIQIADRYENIWATVGIHPEGSGVNLEKAEKEIKSIVNSSKKVVALGECGLDYFRDESKSTEQKALFERQISISKDLNLPLVIHIRNGKDKSAAEDAYQILSQKKIQRGVIHCFTLDKNWAKKFVDLGLYIGFTGIVTYKNANLVCESVKAVPVERLLIETDCPYLAPQKCRGMRNEPAFVTEVAQKITEIKDLTIDKTAEQTTKNAESLFCLEKRSKI